MPSLSTEEEGTKHDFALPPGRGESTARLTVVQITDVYTLEHFASLKTLLREAREQAGDSNVISVLTGDFLAPYLLSSVDRGSGMMNALAKTPVDYLTWGNHEADVDHRTVCRHVRNFPGKWINTNMQSHEAMDRQIPFDVVEVSSEDGTNVRRVGLVAVLSDDPALYAHFKAPGAFGGATIDDPWETLAKYKSLLEGPEHRCDVVLPLQHTYVPDDQRTCREFDFPVVLSGHDHHRVDEIVNGTRLLKPGLDGIYATVLDLIWDDADASGNRPTVEATFVKVSDWDPDETLSIECERAYDALRPLRNTELARIPPGFEPLSSVNARGCVTTMGKYICTLLRSSLNASRRQREHRIDAVLLMGGNVRGGTDYPEGSFFSLEALEAEIKSDETIAVVPMPGRVLSEGVKATHAGDPIPGWMHYDVGVLQDENTGDVTHVGGAPLDPDRIYRVATKIGDLTNGQSPPLTEYYTDNPHLLPAKGAYVNVHAELMSFFARNLWRKIWEAIAPWRIDPPSATSDDNDDVDEGEEFSPTLEYLCDVDNCKPDQRLDALDKDHKGSVSVDDIHAALRDVLGLSVDDDEKSLAMFVHAYADTTGDGEVTLEDFEVFCEEMAELYEREHWRLAFPRRKKLAERSGGGGAAEAVAVSS